MKILLTIFFIGMLALSGERSFADGAAPNGKVDWAKIVGRYSVALRAEEENVYLVRKLPRSEVRKLVNANILSNAKLDQIANEAKSLQAFEVLDCVKPTPAKILIYPTQMTLGYPLLPGLSSSVFSPPEGEIWMIIARRDYPSVSDRRYLLIDIEDPLHALVSAKADNHLNIDVEKFLLDLKVILKARGIDPSAVQRIHTDLARRIFEGAFPGPPGEK